MITRNVVISGNRTTVRLEASVWAALDEISVRERLSRHDLCSRLERIRHGINRAQAIRSAVVSYYRLALRVGSTEPGTFEKALKDDEIYVA